MRRDVDRLRELGYRCRAAGRVPVGGRRGVAHPFSLAAEPVDPDALVVVAATIANHERLRFRCGDEGRHVEPRPW